jgi:hypothetical protein
MDSDPKLSNKQINLGATQCIEEWGKTGLGGKALSARDIACFLPRIEAWLALRGDVPDWPTIMPLIAANPFNLGQNKRGWVISFGWLLDHLDDTVGFYEKRMGVLELFNKAWDLYPKKTDRIASQSTFLSMFHREDQAELFLRAVKNYRGALLESKTEDRYVKSMLSFIGTRFAPYWREWVVVEKNEQLHRPKRLDEIERI